MIRVVAGRLAGGVITLVLLSVLVFAAGQALPGDVGRASLGPLADAAYVAALDHSLGADRPVLVQFFHWAGGVLRGDLGISYAFRAPVAPFIVAALGKSLLLAAVTFVLTVPIALAAGVYAGWHAGRWQDRIVSILGAGFTAVPEFASGIVLILVFGIWLHALPVSAAAPPGAGFFVRIAHLILPALPLCLVLFGYIAGVARAGTTEVLAADFYRTAVLKGLAPWVIAWRHVLPNALTPAVAVIASQTGYLVGGLAVVETLFRYPGIGSLILTAARGRDFPMLEAAVLVVGCVFVVAAALADLLTVWLDPRLRRRGV
jgi:peptide/nickel transport system permease protein